MIHQVDRTTGSLVARFAAYVTDVEEGSPQSLSTRAATTSTSLSDPTGTIINRSLGTSTSQIAIGGRNMVIRKQ